MMAGKKRRTRCEQCKGMFQFGENIVSHKLLSTYKRHRMNVLFCSTECLHNYVGEMLDKEMKINER